MSSPVRTLKTSCLALECDRQNQLEYTSKWKCLASRLSDGWEQAHCSINKLQQLHRVLPNSHAKKLARKKKPTRNFSTHAGWCATVVAVFSALQGFLTNSK